MGSAVDVLKKDRWSRERGKMKLVKKQRKQLCGLGELERGERGDYVAVVKERCGKICMFSLFCSQSVAEESILINSISSPCLGEQQNCD